MIPALARRCTCMAA